MIRNQSLSGSQAFNKEFTEAIRNDDRLPKHSEDIRLHHLPVFAEWQRKLDAAMAVKS